jgi:hypothetical protein
MKNKILHIYWPFLVLPWLHSMNKLEEGMYGHKFCKGFMSMSVSEYVKTPFDPSFNMETSVDSVFNNSTNFYIKITAGKDYSFSEFLSKMVAFQSGTIYHIWNSSGNYFF